MRTYTPFLGLLLAALVSGPTWAAEPSEDDRLMTAGVTIQKTERLGGLYIGQAGSEVLKTLSCAVKPGKERRSEVDGDRHQVWSSPACGVELDMVGKGTKKKVDKIVVSAPFAGASNRGIKIGSTVQEVEKAYRAVWNKGESQPGETFVAGSIYGGMIFMLAQGKVEQIVIGATAE